MRMNLGLQKNLCPCVDLVRRPNAFPSHFFFAKKEGLDSGTSSLLPRVETWCPFELLMGFSVRAGPWFPFDRDPTEVASD
jgi:hypothetical protein